MANQMYENTKNLKEQEQPTSEEIPLSNVQPSSSTGQDSVDASQPEYITVLPPAESSCETEQVEHRRCTRGVVLGAMFTGVCVLGIVIVLSVLLIKKNDQLQSVPPKITVPSRRVTVEKGQNVTLACNATGQPKQLVTWSKSFRSLPQERSHITGGNLTIVNVNTADSGNYVCWATNKLAIKSFLILLIVVSRLQFGVKPPVSYKAYFNEPLLFNCSAKSDLKVHVTWTRENMVSLPSTARVLGNGSLVIRKYKTKYAGLYTCKIANRLSGLASHVTLETRDPKSCSELRRVRGTQSGSYVIDPDRGGGVAPFTVHCDMTEENGVGVTVIRHDSQNRTLVNGFEYNGSYFRSVRYTGASLEQLAALTRISTHCEQSIKYECYESKLLNNGNPDGWWVSHDREMMTYWGGAVRGSYKCACGMTSSCADPSKGCNCDKDDAIWREDSGLLTDKSALPVSELRFGDTGETDEKGYHTLGELKCYGE